MFTLEFGSKSNLTHARYGLGIRHLVFQIQRLSYSCQQASLRVLPPRGKAEKGYEVVMPPPAIKQMFVL